MNLPLTDSLGAPCSPSGGASCLGGVSNTSPSKNERPMEKWFIQASFADDLPKVLNLQRLLTPKLFLLQALTITHVD